MLMLFKLMCVTMSQLSERWDLRGEVVQASEKQFVGFMHFSLEDTFMNVAYLQNRERAGIFYQLFQ